MKTLFYNFVYNYVYYPPTKDKWTSQEIFQEEFLVTPKDILECKGDQIKSLQEEIQSLHGNVGLEASLYEVLKMQKELNEELSIIRKDSRIDPNPTASRS